MLLIDLTIECRKNTQAEHKYSTNAKMNIQKKKKKIKYRSLFQLFTEIKFFHYCENVNREKEKGLTEQNQISECPSLTHSNILRILSE